MMELVWSFVWVLLAYLITKNLDTVVIVWFLFWICSHLNYIRTEIRKKNGKEEAYEKFKYGR